MNSGPMPTSAVKGADDVPTKPSVGFKELLPCLGSRASLGGWYSQVDDALRANNNHKVVKLFSAALSQPLHLRSHPTKKQLVLDSMSYSEDIFNQSASAADSFFAFAQKVEHALESGDDELAVGSMSANSIVDKAKSLGLTFHSAPLNETIVRAIQYTLPFVKDPSVQAAFKALENVSTCLSDQTKCSCLMHAKL